MYYINYNIEIIILYNFRLIIYNILYNYQFKDFFKIK